MRDLIHQPGEMREERIEIIVPEELGAGVIVVPEGTATQLDLRLESVHEGILATADLETFAVGECVRCLNEVRLPIAVNFQELYSYEETEGIDYQISDDSIDIEQVVRDAVVLALPFTPVCLDGCERPELSDGITLVLEDDETATAVDPRWEKLKGFGQDQQ